MRRWQEYYITKCEMRFAWHFLHPERRGTQIVLILINSEQEDLNLKCPFKAVILSKIIKLGCQKTISITNRNSGFYLRSTYNMLPFIIR